MNGNNGSGVLTFVVFGLFLFMMYFLMIRPQKKKEKADKEMRAALKVGDEIITIGGVVGKIEKISENSVVISTTSAKTKMEFLKTAIASVTTNSAAKGSSTSSKAKTEEPKEEKAPSRDKKVTPKKLGKKEEKAEAEEAAE